MMKKNVFFIWILVLLALMSCQKDEIMYYEGPDALNIYLDQYEADSTRYSFALEDDDLLLDTVWIKVRVLGPAKDFDRTIELEATNGTTAIVGKDFDLPQFTLKAGEIDIKYPVLLHRTEKLKDDDEKLIVRIKSNSDFTNGAPGTDFSKKLSIEQYTIYFNDFLSEPGYWTANYLYYYLGDFSVAKFRFMISVYGITDFSAWSSGEIMNSALNLRNALEEYELENGPIYDEYGDRLTF